MSAGYFRPRPEADDELGRTLSDLEAPPCTCKRRRACPAGCPGGEACDHPYDRCDCGEDAPEHGLTLEEWAELCKAYDPGGYAEPPSPAPALAVTRAVRIALYEERARAGLAVMAPGNRLGRSGDVTDIDQVCVRACLGKREAAPGPEALVEGRGWEEAPEGPCAPLLALHGTPGVPTDRPLLLGIGRPTTEEQALARKDVSHD